MPFGMPGPRSRRADPDTSHKAAKRHERAVRGHALRVLEAIRAFPGSTAVELAAKLVASPPAGPTVAESFVVWRYRVSRRTADLARKHPPLIRRGRPRVCSITGSAQTTWYPL